MAIRVLSLGAGVQSTTVLLMSCHGELPPLDHAIFADTGWEPKPVYRHLEWLEGIAAAYNLPIHRVKQSDLKTDALQSQVRGKASDGVRWASMPLFTLGPDGSRGMIRRQCTTEYKVRPIERFIRRQLLGLSPGQRAPKNAVSHYFGISLDEWRRMRRPKTNWQTHCYPLVEQRITRHACLVWLAQHDYPEPPRSACIGCPFHSDAEWRDLKQQRPAEWDDAVAFDHAIRHCGGMRGQIFLHRRRVPLDEVDLRTDVDKGQRLLWDDECSGLCGT